MRISTFYLVSIGIVLALLGFYFETKIPLLASLLALVGAGFLLTAARRMTKERKYLKAMKKKKR